MKKVMAMLPIIFCMVFIVGCGGPPLPEPTQGVIVTIMHRQEGTQPGIKIACSDAVVDKNHVIIKGVQCIGGHNGIGWVGNFKINGDEEMIFELSENTICSIEVLNKKVK